MRAIIAKDAPRPAGHYARFFGDHRPARAIVPTRDLHFGFQIEIEAVAAVNTA